MKNVLVIGYGNPDREDDGVAWHILHALAAHYGGTVSTPEDNLAENPPYPHLAFDLQLTPEMSEVFANYKFVCFVDAHTGVYEDEIRLVPVGSGFQSSPFTHHLTPESCLSLTQTLYHKEPYGLIVSVRGYYFGYKNELSDRTAELAQEATNRIINWIAEEATE